jgi:hypothetical protein
MTEKAYSATRSAEVSHFGMQALWRLAIWGGLATFALFAAVLSAYSNAGTQRQTASVTSGQDTKQPRGDIVEFKAEPSNDEETRRLTEAVRALTADRDQLLTRVAALERNFDGVTGTIKRDRIAASQPAQMQGPPIPAPAQVPAQTPPQTQAQASAQNPASAASLRPETPPGPTPPASTPSAPITPVTPMPVTSVPTAPASMAPASMTPAPITEAALSPAQMPSTKQSSASDASQGAPDAANRATSSSPNLAGLAPPGQLTPSGLGVDVGGAANYEGLRALWHATKNGDPDLLDDLYPMVTVRENSKTHGVELRLVIGPIADAEAASQLCATLTEAHRYCQPVAFDGQRLSLTETTTKAAPAARHAASNHSGSSHGETIPSVIAPSSNYPHGK